MTLPPLTWLTLTVALAAWVQDSFPFPEFWWSPGVVLVLGTAGKLIEIYWPKPEATTNERLMVAQNPPSKMSRLLWG